MSLAYSLDGITAGVTTVLAGYLVVWLDNNEIIDYGWFELNEFQTLSWISDAMRELAENAVSNFNGSMIDYSEIRDRSYFLYL